MVFDGHGGQQVAKFLYYSLFMVIFKQPEWLEGNQKDDPELIKTAIHKGCMFSDIACFDEEDWKDWFKTHDNVDG